MFLEARDGCGVVDIPLRLELLSWLFPFRLEGRFLLRLSIVVVGVPFALHLLSDFCYRRRVDDVRVLRYAGIRRAEEALNLLAGASYWVLQGLLVGDFDAVDVEELEGFDFASRVWLEPGVLDWFWDAGILGPGR